MAKRRTYGNTWWGAAWLEALSSVDEENRLPRGKTYANQGRIIETRFDEAARTVDALVDGSAYFPYEVELKLPALPKEEARQLLKSIADDPAPSTPHKSPRADSSTIKFTNLQFGRNYDPTSNT